MKTKDIKAMAQALQTVNASVEEEYQKDGEVKKSKTKLDKKKKDETEVETQAQEQTMKKETFLDRYKSKLSEGKYATTDAEKVDKLEAQPADKVQSSKEVKQSRETSATKDTSKLDRKEAPKEVDGVKAIQHNDNEENKSQKQASSAKKVVEGYKEVQNRYKQELKNVAKEIYDLTLKLIEDDAEARSAQKRNRKAYAANKKPSKKDLELSSGRLYDCKYLVRQLEDARDAVENKLRGDMTVESLETPMVSETKVANPETRTPLSIHDALNMMQERDEHYKGATPVQKIDDNWSDGAKAHAALHAVQTPAEADINKVVDENKREIDASLRRSVDYRHNDNKIGDKKPVGNDGK